MKRVATGILVLLIFFGIAQTAAAQATARPKLVVGLVIDQMRWDFLYRFAARYGTGGFKRLQHEGFSCENTFIPYIPSYTAPGHTCVYTGSVPALHGMVGNNWYSKEEKRILYCTEDNSVQTVGSNSTAGKMSPKNLWSTTITDELRLAQNFQNKTIGIALKDRGAILPAGHSATAAYWFDASTGSFISSTFYMQRLPQWLQLFNEKKLPDVYLKQGWNTLFPITTYTQSTADSEVFENPILGEDNTFPHKTDGITTGKYETFKYLPGANTYTFDMAKAAIEGEALGQRGVTDMLTISCSATDYMGHAMGPNSVEAEDMYLRLDKDLAQFLNYLDTKIGSGQYLIFLTADHGAAHIPAYLQQHRIPSGTFDDATLQANLNSDLQTTFGAANLVAAVMNFQVYLADFVIAKNGLNKIAIKQRIIERLLQLPGIANAVDLQNTTAATLPEEVKKMLINGYNQKRSGDVQFLFLPQWFDGSNRGTTHGSWNPYDAHIPLLWAGWGIKSGHSNRTVSMTDIAPTLAALLHIQMPSTTVGMVLEEVLK